MIWGDANTTVEQYFYVGTEKQYRHAVASNEGRPFNESRNGQSIPQSH